MPWSHVALLLLLALPASGAPTIEGAWRPELYTLKDGTEHEVTGLIFFTELDWTVLFFVKGKGGALERGSAEGGTYTLDGDRLVFTHLYRLSGVAGAASGTTMSVKGPEEAETEPCRIEMAADELTIHFPSGNRMRFRRSSGS